MMTQNITPHDVNKAHQQWEDARIQYSRAVLRKLPLKEIQDNYQKHNKAEAHFYRLLAKRQFQQNNAA